MRIVGLEGSQTFAEEGGSEFKFVMIVLHNGGYYNVPIVFETYQILSEVGAIQGGGHFEGEQAEKELLKVMKPTVIPQTPQPPQPVEQNTFVGKLEEKSRPSKDDINALEFMSKIGAFGKPEDVLQAMGRTVSEVEGADGIESFEDSDDEDPGEENEENETEQW